MHRAMLFAELEAIPRAIEDAAAAIEAQPEEPDAYLLRGKMRASQGDLDGGLADLDLALKLDPHHAESRVLSGTGPPRPPPARRTVARR